MTRVSEGSHSFTCHSHVYPQVEWTIPAFTPQPQSITAHFGWYSFPVPLRVGGWVGPVDPTPSSEPSLCIPQNSSQIDTYEHERGILRKRKHLSTSVNVITCGTRTSELLDVSGALLNAHARHVLFETALSLPRPDGRRQQQIALATLFQQSGEQRWQQGENFTADLFWDFCFI